MFSKCLTFSDIQKTNISACDPVLSYSKVILVLLLIAVKTCSKNYNNYFFKFTNKNTWS